MDGQSEPIALLLGERKASPGWRGLPSEGAMQLVRGPDGEIELRPVESAEEFDRIARTTGCFRRGKPIRDPDSREVIGYEMEEVPLLLRT
jgi:hypothetical protein